MKFAITNNNGNIKIENNKLYEYNKFIKSDYNILTNLNKEFTYTIIIYDESSKSPDYIHLLIINNNNVILQYEPPNPTAKSGEHKYHVCIYKQSKRITCKTTNRYNFNTQEFVYNNNLTAADCMTFKVIHY
jgi:hypothetical protein